MSTLEIYNQRFADSGQRVFARALNGARRRGQNYVVVEHLIEALVAEEERLFQLLAGLFKIDLGQVQAVMEKRLESFPQQASGNMRLAPATIALLKQAREVARNDHRPKIESIDLIMAMARDERGLLIELLKGLNADADAAAGTIQALGHCAQILLLNLVGNKTGRSIFKSGNLRIVRLSPPRSGETTFIPKKDTRPRKLEGSGE